jgi:hypothetical protein
MGERFEAKLRVNNESVELNEFVEEFLARTVVGAASSLKGTGDIQNLYLNVERGDVSLTVNEEDISLTPFPSDIIASTFVGLVSSLKGTGKVESLKINVKVI